MSNLSASQIESLKMAYYEARAQCYFYQMSPVPYKNEFGENPEQAMRNLKQQLMEEGVMVE